MDRAPIYAAWKPLRSPHHKRVGFRWSDVFLAPRKPPNNTYTPPGRRAGWHRWVGLLLVATLLGGAGWWHGAPTAQANSSAQPRRIMSGWLPYWNTQAALQTVTTNADLFADALPFWFQLRHDGSVISHTTDATITTTVQQLHHRGIPVLPTITQVQNAPQMASFLSNAANRNRHVNDIVALVARYRLAGIDLDYESMVFGGTLADRVAVKNSFSQLVRELAQALHAQGKKLSITVGARTSTSNSGNWAVYDYAALGAVADKFRIMTYDYGWSGGAPNPVAPYWWVDQVLKHATQHVGAGKIWMGLPSYGYDWRLNRDGTSAGQALAVTYATARQLQATHGSSAMSLLVVCSLSGLMTNAIFLLVFT